MTITARGAGAVVAGTGGALAPAFPATIAAGDAAWINWHAKPDTVAAPTITGWTKVVDRVSGGGTAGVGTGPTRHAVYRKDGDCAGTEGGTTVSVPAVTGANMNQASIFAANKTLTSWDIAYTTGDQTTAVTAVSITESPAEAETTNDLMAMAVSGAANTNLGSQTVNATGATFGTATEHVDTGTANGDDGRLGWVSRPVTGGPATAASVYSGTATAAETVGVVFLRIRETSGTSISASDTVVGADTASVGVTTSGGDTAASVDSATLGASLTAADTATGVDNATVSTDTQVSASDTAATVDAASLGTALSAADTATGVDAVSLAAAQTSTDVGTGADTATISASLTATDIGSGVDAASVTTPVSASDTAMAVDNATVTTAVTATDAAAGVEAISLSVALTGSDTGFGVDSAVATLVVRKYRFSPPTHEEPIRPGKDMPQFISYYRLTYAQSVVKTGGTFRSIRTPSAESLVGLVEGVDFFRGGYEYVIDQATNDSLTAAGYAPTLI